MYMHYKHMHARKLIITRECLHAAIIVGWAWEGMVTITTFLTMSKSKDSVHLRWKKSKMHQFMGLFWFYSYVEQVLASDDTSRAIGTHTISSPVYQYHQSNLSSLVSAARLALSLFLFFIDLPSSIWTIIYLRNTYIYH